MSIVRELFYPQTNAEKIFSAHTMPFVLLGVFAASGIAFGVLNPIFHWDPF